VDGICLPYSREAGGDEDRSGDKTTERKGWKRIPNMVSDKTPKRKILKDKASYQNRLE
jgi:hypothetical protein